MKRLDRYVLLSFIKVFIPTLLVSVFTLMMQLLWKYIDYLVGRGIEWYYIVELLFFWSAQVVPMALPIAVLLSSIMTFGGYGEHYELAAMRSAGISLYRIMRPLIVLMCFIAVGMYYFSNDLIPVANFKGENLLINISKQKPAFNLIPGVFYDGIEGYAIKIGAKDENSISDVYIYDFTGGDRRKSKVIIAESGEMNLIENDHYLEFKLYNGATYEEITPQARHDRDDGLHVKSEFKQTTLRISMLSLSQGDMNQVNRRKHYRMLNTDQLLVTYDSLSQHFVERQRDMAEIMSKKYWHSSAIVDTTFETTRGPNFLNDIPVSLRKRAIENALRLARNNRSQFMDQREEFDYRLKYMARHLLEWHKKFAVSIGCLILFFIGAPFGAIIRKGGVGLPFVISIVLFLVYHVLITIFSKMGEAGDLSAWLAVWLPSIILLPIGITLTVKAARDSSILDAESYLRPIRWLTQLFKARTKNEENSTPLQ
ncbi:MAG: YjgP/YjgQ family permease [Flavobacteriia bacterium]|nr:YjgP/YjgQ family permease [Flavobacteriia bacterium]